MQVVGGSGTELLDGILDCFLEESPSGDTDRALDEVQSDGLLRAISPSFTALDSSPVDDIIERAIASFDCDFGQDPLPDLADIFPDLDDLLESYEQEQDDFVLSIS